jgi:hypothetical protein
MAQLHGGELGSEVCALIVDSWELRGDARYLAAQARATGDADLSRAAASLLASARQAARDAWQMAALEAETRRDSRRVPHSMGPLAAVVAAAGRKR